MITESAAQALAGCGRTHLHRRMPVRTNLVLDLAAIAIGRLGAK